MGRKRHPIISEYFNRHEKLPDGSNRYEHSCKACGERFPKGRIETLQTHLAKHCAAIQPDARQRALSQFHRIMPENGSGAENALHTDLPFAPKPSMTALDALAEISSQHLGSNRASTPGGSAVGKSGHDGAAHMLSADDFLVSDARGPEENGVDITRTNHSEASNGSTLPSIYHFGGMRHSPPPSPRLSGVSHSASTMATSPLIMTASAANDLQASMPNSGFPMEPDLGLGNSPIAGLSDRYFNRPGRPLPGWSNLPAIDPLLQEPGRPNTGNQEDTPSKVASYPRAIAINPNSPQTQFANDLNASQKSTKAKVRGRFSDVRRKEVQEVRKRGACVRCRMLKKPCSGDNPCSTCQSVESARLWKQPCIRTRLADEFKLYSVGLHQRSAFSVTTQVKAKISFESVPGRIEATNFPESMTYATFIVLRGLQPVAGPIDPALLGSGEKSVQQTTEYHIIDAEADDLCGKLEQYLKRVASYYYDTEESSFMRPTLLQAQRLTEGDKDSLLSRVLELWTVTSTLTTTSPPFHLYINPTFPPSMSPATFNEAELEALSTNNDEQQRVPISPNNSSASYDIIAQQLLGATEKRGGNLSKWVMNELERRLLQRQQANHFETFLVAVILLACVERMCGYFKGWDTGLAPSPSELAMAQQSRQALGILGEGLGDDWGRHSSHAGTIDQALVDALGGSTPGGTGGPDHDSTNTVLDATSHDVLHGGRGGAMDLDSNQPSIGASPSLESPNQQSHPIIPDFSSPSPPGSVSADQNAGDGHQRALHQSPEQSPGFVRWPLERKPPDLAQQGERFSDIVHMLLKLRQILPKTEVRPGDGILLPVGSNQETGGGSAREWFEAVKIRPKDLADGTRFVNGGYGNYIAKLLGRHE